MEREDEIDGPGPDGGGGHPENLARFLVLGDDHSAHFLDESHAVFAVAVGSGQDDADDSKSFSAAGRVPCTFADCVSENVPSALTSR